MIKRRFYKLEHGDKDGDSPDSSSSSDSEVEAEAEAEAEASVESEDEGHDTDDNSDAVAEEKESNENDDGGGDELCSSSSGYESEDSSANEISADSSGFRNEDHESGDGEQIPSGPLKSGKGVKPLKKEFTGIINKEALPVDMPDCVLKCKSVYKCRICPRIVCLNEETMRVHLQSKRHSRSEKLLKENRLRFMLDSDGEIENQETPAEMNARIVALAQENTKKKNKGRQRQRKRSREKKAGVNSNAEKAGRLINNPAKKRRKDEN